MKDRTKRSQIPYSYYQVRQYGKRDIGICTICGKQKPVWNNSNGIKCKECSQ